MGIGVRWVGEEDLDRAAQVQVRCYAGGAKELEGSKEWFRKAHATGTVDIILAERDSGGEAVASAMCWAYTMWVRGAPLPCQGVGGVGTIRTDRRGRGGDGPGAASLVMREVIRHARQRGQVISALMPFRASFYEHFGYGLVERQHEWTVPLLAMPTGSLDGFEYFDAARDLPRMKCYRQQMVQRGQCDIERNDWMWRGLTDRFGDGFVIVDRGADSDGLVRSWMYLRQRDQDGRRILSVEDVGWDSVESLVRQLHFLASQRDQFAAATMTLPADLQLNWLLKERQLVGWQTNHPAAQMKARSMMMVRVLDHRRFLEALHLPPQARGEVVVAVRESEGGVSKFQLAIDAGRANVSATDAAADVECSDSVWAAIGCGSLTAHEAAGLGLLATNREGAADLLACLADGPMPFCRESF